METLRDKINLDNNDSYILFEQGGIGKTSQMKAVFRSYALSYKDGIVPVFVDCKTIDFNRKQPLLTHILLKFCGDDCPDNCENSIVRLENMLIKANSEYKYIFFIDGINECENNKYLVVQDITKLLKSPNNKVIVSSRINEDDIGLKDFKRLRVKEFTDAQIVTFLNSKGFKDNGNDVELNRLNPSLLKILRVPMFLKLFVETYSADNVFHDMYTSNIVRKADLLQAFINKIFDDKNEQHISENDPEYIKRQFALEHYLPSLAYEMMIMHKYSINNEVLKNLRTQVFTSNYFERFEREDEDIFKHISSIKEINNICIEEFSLLNKSNDNFVFSHQVWQDFFCGKFYELCIKYDILEPFENALPESVKQFIGEIIGECDFENETKLEKAKKSPLNQFLQKHNRISDNPISPNGTKNIIEIMKSSRTGVITGDYSSLNLLNSDFLNVNCKNSNFFNSLLNLNTFCKFQCIKTAIAYDEEKDCLWLGDVEGKIFFVFEDGSLHSADELYENIFSDLKFNERISSINILNGDKVLICAANSNPKIFDKKSGRCTQILNLRERFQNGYLRYEKVVVSNSNWKLIFPYKTEVSIWELKGKDYIERLHIKIYEFSLIISVSVSSDEHYLLISGFPVGQFNEEFLLLDLINLEKTNLSFLCEEVKNIVKATIFDNDIIFFEKNIDATLESEFNLKKYNLNSHDIEKLLETNEELQIFTDAEYLYANGRCYTNIYERGCYKKEVINNSWPYGSRCAIYAPKHKRVFYFSGINIVIYDYSRGVIENPVILSQGTTLNEHVLNYSKNNNKFYVLFHGSIKVVDNNKYLSVIDTFKKADNNDSVLSFSLNEQYNVLVAITHDYKIQIIDIDSGIIKLEFNNCVKGGTIAKMACINNKVFFSSYEENSKYYYVVDLSKKTINKLKRLDGKKDIDIKGIYLYETDIAKSISHINIFNLQTNILLKSITINNAFLNSRKSNIKDILYMEKQDLIYICFYCNDKMYFCFDSYGNKLLERNIDFSRFDGIKFVDNLICVNDDTLAFYCDYGVATYSLSKNEILASNTDIIYSNITGSDFRGSKIRYAVRDKKSLSDIISKNGGII